MTPQPRHTSGPHDSPRWCDHCKAWGDHHTDRCPRPAQPGQSDDAALDPLGEYLHAVLTPTSSKKRPAYGVARTARNIVADELIFAAGEAGTCHVPELGETLAAWIRRELSE